MRAELKRLQREAALTAGDAANRAAAAYEQKVAECEALGLKVQAPRARFRCVGVCS